MAKGSMARVDKRQQATRRGRRDGATRRGSSPLGKTSWPWYLRPKVTLPVNFSTNHIAQFARSVHPKKVGRPA